MEWANSAVPDLLRHLGHPLNAARVAWPQAALPAGTVMAMYPTPTTVGAFWDHYVAPVVRAQTLIRDVRRRHGGMRAIRLAWRTAWPRQSEFGAQASRHREVA
jgi:hypothetical protein